MFGNKTILLVSPEPWDHIFVSKHHYAVHLARRGSRVFFLNPPTGYESIRSTDYGNVFSITYSGFPSGLRYYPSILQRVFIKRKFLELQRLCDVVFDVVWSFDNSVFFDFSALPSEILKISHIVDLNQDFQTRRAASTADFCFCTTELIKKRLLKFNSHVFKINHGFNSPSSDAYVQLPGKSKIKALYSGNLAMPFIDWVLIHNIVKANLNVDFVFVGPDMDVLVEDVQQNRAKKDTYALTNSYFIGKVESKELLRYLVAANILLVAYQEKYHMDQSNPHKMMEYLGAGRIVVATHTAEFRELHSKQLILMSNKNAELPSLFKKAVEEIELWNCDEKRELRVSFAMDNTYEKNIEKIEAIINTRS